MKKRIVKYIFFISVFVIVTILINCNNMSMASDSFSQSIKNNLQKNKEIEREMQNKQEDNKDDSASLGGILANGNAFIKSGENGKTIFNEDEAKKRSK